MPFYCYYRIIIKKTTAYATQYLSLGQLLPDLYCGIFHKNNKPCDTEVVLYYNNIPVTRLSVIYDDGLLLFNESNHVKITSFYPEYLVLDSQLKQILSSTHPENDYFEKNKIIDNNKDDIDEIFPINEAISDTEIDMEINNTLNIPYDNINIFENDKKSYLKIKNDIESGHLELDQIHPHFSLKYQIFKILELRNDINFNCDDHIKDEFAVFSKIYEASKDDIEQENKPYVPHNYNYLTTEQKEEYATKYNSTKEQLSKIF